MKKKKIFLLLVLFSIIYSKVVEIENGETVEFTVEEETNYITYNFSAPQSDEYKSANLFFKCYNVYGYIYENI